MSTFVEELGRLWPSPLTTTMTMSGAIRVQLGDAKVVWDPVRALLAEHDKCMVLRDGVATFTPLGETPSAGTALPEPTRQITAGPVTKATYDGLSCNSADLNAASDRPGVLRVVVGKQISVEAINASDIKDGLHHLHRRGRVRPVFKQISRHACKHSQAAKRAASRLAGRGSVIRSIRRSLGF